MYVIYMVVLYLDRHYRKHVKVKKKGIKGWEKKNISTLPINVTRKKNENVSQK